MARKKKVKAMRSTFMPVNKVMRGSFEDTATGMEREAFGAGTGSSGGNSPDEGKQIGSFCGLIFVVNSKKILTPRNIKQEISGEWGEHSVIGAKPKTEFLGAGIRRMTFDITIDAMLGVRPHSVLRKMNDMTEDGAVGIFMLGTHKIGRGKWKMEQVSEDFSLVYSRGELIRASGGITLSEYF